MSFKARPKLRNEDFYKCYPWPFECKNEVIFKHNDFYSKYGTKYACPCDLVACIAYLRRLLDVSSVLPVSTI